MKKVLWGLLFLSLAGAGAFAASITVTKPAANETWPKGATQLITWIKTGTLPDTVRITLRNQSSTTLIRTIADAAPNSGSYSWPIPTDIPDGQYRIRVKARGVDVEDDSEVFNLGAAPGGKKMKTPGAGAVKTLRYVKILTPTENSKWKQTQTMIITFEAVTVAEDGFAITLRDATGNVQKEEIFYGGMNKDPSGLYKHSWYISRNDLFPNGWYQIRVASVATNISDMHRFWMEIPTNEVKVTRDASISNWRMRRWYNSSGEHRGEHSLIGNESPEYDPPNCGERPGQGRVGFHISGSGNSYQLIIYRALLYTGIDAATKSNYRLEWLKSAVLRLKRSDYGFRQNCNRESCIGSGRLLTAPWQGVLDQPSEFLLAPGDTAEETFNLFPVVRDWWNGKPDYGILLKAFYEDYPPPHDVLMGCVAYYTATLELTFDVPVY